MEAVDGGVGMEGGDGGVGIEGEDGGSGWRMRMAREDGLLTQITPSSICILTSIHSI